MHIDSANTAAESYPKEEYGKVNRYSLGSYNLGEEHTTFTGGSASEFLNNDEQLVFGIGYVNPNFNPERKYTLDKDQVVAIAQG